MNLDNDFYLQDDKELFEAACKLNFSKIKDLVSQGYDINCYEGAVLRFACYNGRFDIVKFAIENFADINIADGFPLYYSIYYGFYDIVTFLINNGAKIKNIPGVWCNDPLYAAIKNGNIDLIKYLLEQGCEYTNKCKLLLENHRIIIKNRNIIANTIFNHFKIISLNNKIDFHIDENCPISYEKFNYNELVVGCSICKHIFKKDVFDKWIELGNKRCPYALCSDPIFYNFNLMNYSAVEIPLQM